MFYKKNIKCIREKSFIFEIMNNIFNILCLVLICLYIPFDMPAQDLPDSTSIKLKTLSSDKKKGIYLREITGKLTSNNPELSVKFGKAALSYLDTLEDKEEVIKTYIQMGWSYKNLAEYDKALNYINKAYMGVYGEKNMEKLLASVYNTYGIIFARKEEQDKSLGYYNKALNIYKEQNDSLAMANTFNNIAILYHNKGDLGNSLKIYYKSLRIFEQLENEKGISLISNNIGTILNERGEYKKAMKYFLGALRLYKKNNDKRNLSNTYHNIALLYFYLEKYEKAIEYFQLSLQIAEELKDKWGLMYSYGSMGEAYFKLNNLQRAMELFNKSLNYALEIDDKWGIADAYKNIAQIKLQNNRVGEAEELLKKAVHIAEKYKFKELQVKSYKLLSSLYEKSDNYKASLQLFKQYKSVYDSLNSEKKDRNIREINAKYQLEKKQHEIYQLESEKKIQALEMKKQSNYLLFLFIIIILGFILLILIVYGYRVYRTKNRTLQAEMSNRKEYEKALLRSEEKYRILIENANEGIAIVQNNTIVYVNPFIELMFNYAKEQIIGKNFNEFVKINPETGKIYFKLLSRQTTVYETILADRDNKDIVVEITSSRIHYNDKLSKLLLIRNITEVKQTKELKNQLEIEQKAARMKHQFLANMGHEIRTPMNGILGMSEILMTTATSAQEKEFAEIVYSSSASLMKIINEIFEYIKLDTGKTSLRYSEFDMKKLFNDLEKLFRATAKQKNLHFTIEDPREFPKTIVADRNRLMQVLTNLTSNALKFTNKGSVIIRYHLDKKTKDNNCLWISIEDTGIGISETNQEKLYKVFTQVDDSDTRFFGGTGLGLATAKELIELMGGKIDVRSKEGKGTTFTFNINCKPEKSTDLSPSTGNDALLISNGIKILIYESVFSYRRILQSILSKSGFDTRFEENTIVKNIQDYGLIIAEYNEDLKEVFLEMKKYNLLPPLIITSEEPKEEIPADMAENFYILKKPIKQNELMNLVGKILQEK